MTIGKVCKRCGYFDYTIKKRKASDGHWQIVVICKDCNQLFQTDFLKKSDYDLDALEEHPALPPKMCEICGKPYAQLHHYFPQSIARAAGIDPDKWPTGYLDEECHNLWHKFVTPNLKRGIK